MRGRVTYQGFVSSQIAVNFSYSKLYNDPSGKSYQRLIDKKRCKDFANYLSQGDVKYLIIHFKIIIRIIFPKFLKFKSILFVDYVPYTLCVDCMWQYIDAGGFKYKSLYLFLYLICFSICCLSNQRIYPSQMKTTPIGNANIRS